MRWWFALVTGATVLLAILFMHHRTIPSNKMSETVSVVPSASSSLVTSSPASRLAAAEPVTTTPAVPVPTPAPEEQRPAWMADSDTEPRALYAKVRRESRDPDWAARTEGAIRARIADVPYLDARENTARCASTVCEITGSTPPGIPEADANAARQALQNGSFRDALQKQGLVGASGVFGGDGSGRATFTLYYRRAEPGH